MKSKDQVILEHPVLKIKNLTDKVNFGSKIQEPDYQTV